MTYLVLLGAATLIFGAAACGPDLLPAQRVAYAGQAVFAGAFLMDRWL